jgi:hypothetical protein
MGAITIQLTIFRVGAHGGLLPLHLAAKTAALWADEIDADRAARAVSIELPQNKSTPGRTFLLAAA